MTETGWKFDLYGTADQKVYPPAHPQPRRGLRLCFQGVLSLILIMPVWAQISPASSTTASSEQLTSLPSASEPVSGQFPTQTESAFSSAPALGPSLQVPAAANGSTTANGSAWHSLSKRQKQALAPLAEEWHGLTAQQRQKWLVLSKNFAQLSDEEQLTLHSRMREWAALSPRQRSQARFHFNAMPSLSAQDKRAQWAAYQALSEQEKSKLSSGPKPPVKSVARSFAPPSTRLVSPPLLPVNTTRAVSRVAPSKPIHPKTLLPQPS